MRHVLLTSLLLTATMACTRTHRVATPGPLPDDEVDHVRGALQGAGLGVLAGAAAGAAFGYSRGDDHCNNQEELCLFSLTAGEKAVMGGIYVGAIGAVSGLVIGAIYGSHDVYEREEGLVPSVSASVAPGRASAALSWSF